MLSRGSVRGVPGPQLSTGAHYAGCPKENLSNRLSHCKGVSCTVEIDPTDAFFILYFFPPFCRGFEEPFLVSRVLRIGANREVGASAVGFQRRLTMISQREDELRTCVNMFTAAVPPTRR